MKILKKAISLIMAVVIMITTSPILQATDSVNLDMNQLKQLQKEFLPSLMDEVESEEAGLINNNSEGFPSYKELEKRYKEALKNYKKLKKQMTRKERKELEKKTQEALEIAKEYDLFTDYEDDKERAEVAFYTFLFDSMNKTEGEIKHSRGDRWGLAYCSGGATGAFVGWFISLCFMLDKKLAYNVSVVIGSATLGTVLAFLLIPKNLNAPTSHNDRYVSLYAFENPFEYIGTLYAYNNFETFYMRGENSSKMLRDIVDIEYYVSRNPSAENMRYRILPYTDYWKKMNYKVKEEYISETAQLLREQASQYEMPFYKPEWEEQGAYQN